MFSPASHDGFFISMESGSVCRKEWGLGLVGGAIDGFQSFENVNGKSELNNTLLLRL